LALFGCAAVSGSAMPRWPTVEAKRAFDTSAVKSKPSTKIMVSMMFSLGMTHVCGDVPLPHEDPFNDFDKVDKLYQIIQEASIKELTAEIDRLHPGYPGNSDIALGIWLHMLEAAEQEGNAAATRLGCKNFKESAMASLNAITAWRPSPKNGAFDEGRR
jgi:hypothetical protein